MKIIWPSSIKLGLVIILGFYFQLLSGQTKNILWITAEDLSPRFSFYGDSTVATPNLDRLAAEGQVYSNAFATYGVCAPSRHSIIMGMYPTTTGAGAMRTWKRTSAIDDITDTALLNIPVYEATPPPEAKCFSEYLRSAGYYCTNNFKTDYQFRTPFTAWDENSPTAHWRNRPNAAMPFFSVFNFEVTHESKIHHPPSPERVDPSVIDVPPYYPDTKTVRRDIAHHYDNIIALDSQIAVILDQLEEDGLIDETIIFFFGDHGDGLPRAKRWVYDSGIRIPLIVRHPDGRKGEVDELVSFVDFAPTMLSICQIPIPSHMQGQAFLGPQKASAPRQYIYAFRDRMDPAPETIRAVRDKRFKYIRNYRPDLPYLGFIPYRDRMAMMKEILTLKDASLLGPNQWQLADTSKPIEELYDLRNDPHEIHNLAADAAHPETLKRLRAANDAFQDRFTDLGMIPEGELIKHLWPPNGDQPKTETPEISIREDMLYIECKTNGASIGYQINEMGPWLLYSDPIPADGIQIISAKAIRLGYQPSGMVTR